MPQQQVFFDHRPGPGDLFAVGDDDRAVVGRRLQAGTSFGCIVILPVFASRVPTSTRHMRQLPTTDSPGCQQ